MRLILSTIGTSILTNYIGEAPFADTYCREKLRDSANLKSDELSQVNAMIVS